MLKILFNSWISERTSDITSSEKNSGDCWDEFTNGSRTGQYPQGSNHLHSAGNNLHFHGWESFALYQISTSLSQFSGHILGLCFYRVKI